MSEKSELRWNWPACPLATGSPGENRLLLFGEGKEGAFENHIIFDDPNYQPPEHHYLSEDEGQGRVRQTYWPNKDDLQAVASYAFRPDRPGDVDWLAIQRDLIRRGERLADLKRCSAPELVKVLLDSASTKRKTVRQSKLAEALACLIAHLDWTDCQIAEEIGVSRTTLYTWPEFKQARKVARDGCGIKMIQGSKAADGTIEAADE